MPRFAWVVLAVLLVAGCTSTADRSGSAKRVQGANGLSVEVPHGWTVDTADPARLRVYEHGLWIGENCSARERKHVGVRFDAVRPGAPGTDAVQFGPRPTRFTTESGAGLSSGFADQPCGSSSQVIRFTEKGRLVDTYLDFGSRADARARSRVYEILNSLRVSAAS